MNRNPFILSEGAAQGSLLAKVGKVFKPVAPSALTPTALNVVTPDAVTNAVTRGLTLSHTTSGTAAAGIGAGLILRAESAGGTLRSAGAVDAIHTDATNGAETSALILSAGIAGTLFEVARCTALPASVNGLELISGEAGAAAVVTVRGSDTNVPLGLASKGTGRVLLAPGGSTPMLGVSSTGGVHARGDTQTGVSPTVSRPCGVVRVQSGATSVTVTNTLCAATSLVFAQIRNITTNAVSVLRVEPGNGSFVVRLTGDPGISHADLAFWVVQPDA